MSFIGILSENKLNFEKTLENQENKYEIIELDKDNIGNMKNIKFETILVIDNVFNLKDNLPVLQKILKNAKYLIINSDIRDNLSILGDLDLTVVTYGFNSKAAISVSSTESNGEDIVLCIQRTIKCVKGNIEPQEVKIEVSQKDIYMEMGILAINIIYGINLSFM